MKPHGLLTQVAVRLSMTDREIAKDLGLSVAALRSLDGPTCPRYLKLALAALVVDIDADTILQLPSETLPASSSAHPRNITPKQGVGLSHAPILDRGFDY